MTQPLANKPYWLTEAALLGENSLPKSGGILIIGSGLSGVSTAYWLQKFGMTDLVIVDEDPERAASFRNCGHILYGTVESMAALKALHGEEVAKQIWQLSIDLCHDVRDTVSELALDCEYKQDGYLVIAIDEAENEEIKQSIKLLNDMGFSSDYVNKDQLTEWGFKNSFGARYEKGSAQAHPVKFRNGLLKHCIDHGLKFHQGYQIESVDEDAGGVKVKINGKQLHYDAVVIAANAYSPLFSSFFKDHKLVEPFRGQIIASKPLKHKFDVPYPHSFDHGYEYAIVSADNRLVIGGWRNNTPAGEIGTYDLSPNPMVTEGLINFVSQHYQIEEDIEWQYHWAGIMATSKTGFPFIGPTSSPLIFTCSGYTGHGFSWAHGSAKLLAKIMVGQEVPKVVQKFRPYL